MKFFHFSFFIFCLFVLIPNVVSAESSPTCAVNSSYNGERCACDDGYYWNDSQTVCLKRSDFAPIPVNQNLNIERQKSKSSASASSDNTLNSADTATSNTDASATKKVATTPQSIMNQETQKELGTFVTSIGKFFQALGQKLNAIKIFFVNLNAYLAR